MRSERRSVRRAFILCCAGGLLGPPALAQVAAGGDLLDDLPPEPQALADTILKDVEAIRGLEFRGKIDVENQSRADFESFVDAEIERSLPPARAAAFGREVKALGLYKGPLIEDPVALSKELVTSQVAAYYDPDSTSFYVLLQDAPMSMLAPVYAHELYHGLQDQYFDLDSYLLDATQLDDDQLLARQAVVEGEATYVMDLWMLRKVSGHTPSRLAVSAMVLAQSLLSASSISEIVLSGIIPGASDDLKASAEAMQDIPPFMIETMLAAYIKGMVFVNAVVGPQFTNADRLYSDPPSSTEQILHPDKWLNGDDPVRIEFPDSAAEPALAGWKLLDSNVIGELQWRLIFREFGLVGLASSSAAGWDGDRFALFERDGKLLLLIYSRWDSAAEADEFAANYRMLLPLKYPGGESTKVDVRGADVLIVEGGEPEDSTGYLTWLEKATPHD